MSALFLQILSMSISASLAAVAVMLLRLVLKRAPRWITVLLWGIVAVRLVLPISIESEVSLMPSMQTVSPQTIADGIPEISTGVTMPDSTVISDATTTAVRWLPIAAAVWCIGIAVMLAYTAVSYLRLRRSVATAVHLYDSIYRSEAVSSPFVLGVARPRIYLPFNMSEQDAEHVIAHELAHIRRGDHLWKPLGFLLVTLHWFNPLLWVGYILLCRDIELACDQRAVRGLDTDRRADYSQALLNCSVNRRSIAACPLAFGEVGVKNRVRSVLGYKKPAFLVILLAVIASIVTAVCFLTDPVDKNDGVIEKLFAHEDYEVVEQQTRTVTLSLPRASLPSAIFSEKGKSFDSLVAYRDETTSICLKEARYSNESTDNLYFCFDFEFELDREQGRFVYPYEIEADGASGAVGVTDGVLRADNGEFEDAVNDRGQGSHELIWFYVSADALKHAEGNISFDIHLNEITYFLDADDHTPAPDSDTVTVVSAAELEKLKLKFPMYFDLPTQKGLEVYIWQLAEGAYSCGLLSGKNLGYSQEELWNLHKNSATLEEMRAIVASYLPDITQDDVTVHAIGMPHSSYFYTIDAAYRQKLTNLFWDDFPMLQATSYSPIISTAVFDIDGDGRQEQVTLSHGTTSGVYSFILKAVETDVSESGGIEYLNLFTAGDGFELSFINDTDGKTRLRAVPTEGDAVYLYDIGVSDGNITLTGQGMSFTQTDKDGNVIYAESHPEYTP